MNYELILAWGVCVLLVFALIHSISKATTWIGDDKFGAFFGRLLENLLKWAEKIIPFYKKNK